MIREYDLAAVVRIYEGSNGDATKALYTRLELLGGVGKVAVNVFRATKNSERAKVYRRRSSKFAAYDTKEWAINNLAEILSTEAEALGLTWGWGRDDKQSFHVWVLYLDLPTGQVSFHTDARGNGPDYPSVWDGMKGQGPDRVCHWVVRLLNRSEGAQAA